MLKTSAQRLLETGACAQRLETELKLATTSLLEAREDVGVLVKRNQSLVHRPGGRLGGANARGDCQLMRGGGGLGGAGGSETRTDLGGDRFGLRQKGMSTHSAKLRLGDGSGSAATTRHG